MNSSILFNLGFDHWQAFLLSATPALCTLGTLVYFRRFSHNRLNRIYLLYLVSTFGWQACDSLCRLSLTEETARLWERLLQPIYIIQFTAWLHCILLISKKKKITSIHWLIDLLYVTTFLIGLASATGIFTQNFSFSPFWGWVKKFDSFFNIPLIWVMLQIICTLYLQATFAFSNRYSPELKIITKALFFAYAIPVIISSITEVIFPLVLNLPPIPIAATAMLTVVIVFFQLITYKVFNFSETMNAEHVAEIIQEPIFVVSQKRTVTYINPNGKSLVANGTIIKKLTDLFSGNLDSYLAFEQQVIGPAFEKKEASRYRFTMLFNGKEIHWDTTTYPILNRNKIGGLLVMCRDISYQVLMAESKLIALRSQMNPHFIFNSLNAIQHYIHANQKETAEKFLSTFAILIRKILDNSANSFIPLTDELQTIKLYLKLEKTRFGNRLNYSVEVDHSLDSDNILIPSMLIQPYIENAILHGITPKEHGGFVSISIQKENDMIICKVTDDGVGRNKAAEIKTRKLIEKRSYGMSITKARLDLLNQQLNIPVSVAIEDLYNAEKISCGTRIEIRMPVHHRF